MQPIVAVLGTRPEAIKFAPVLAAIATHTGLVCETIVTGQQADLLRDQLDALRIVTHHRLSVMNPGQSVQELLVTSVRALAPLIRRLAPRAVLVQGDTTTALAGALVAAFEQVPVVHIEAGLRSFNLLSPYPEEANRLMVSHLSALHCAATTDNVGNLIKEGIAPESIVLTGNPIVDAITEALPQAQAAPALAQVLARHQGRRLVTLTIHRRENFGARMTGFARVAREFIARRADCALIAPVHPNPEVTRCLKAELAGQPRIELVAPLGYHDFLALLQASALVLSDSGGVQEEVAVIGVPLLVLRDSTERPEILRTDLARLARSPAELETLLAPLAVSSSWPPARPLAVNPFGDGRSGPRIARAVAEFLEERVAIP